MSTIVYKLPSNHELIAHEYQGLNDCLAESQTDGNPFDFAANAFVLSGIIYLPQHINLPALSCSALMPIVLSSQIVLSFLFKVNIGVFADHSFRQLILFLDKIVKSLGIFSVLALSRSGQRSAATPSFTPLSQSEKSIPNLLTFFSAKSISTMLGDWSTHELLIHNLRGVCRLSWTSRFRHTGEHLHTDGSERCFPQDNTF